MSHSLQSPEHGTVPVSFEPKIVPILPADLSPDENSKLCATASSGPRGNQMRQKDTPIHAAARIAGTQTGVPIKPIHAKKI